MIKRCFNDFTKEKIVTLYSTIVRPLLEYCAPAWSPNLKKHKDALEKVQKRCLKLCKEDISEEFDSLEDRRRKTDLIETYKLTKKMYKTDPDMIAYLHQMSVSGVILKSSSNHAVTQL